MARVGVIDSLDARSESVMKKMQGNDNDIPSGYYAAQLMIRAKSYFSAFEILSSAALEKHPHPCLYLLSHSLELSLKSFLASRGVNLKDLQLKYRHNFRLIFNDCLNFGFPSVDGLSEIIDGFDNMGEKQFLRFPVDKELIIHNFDSLGATVKAIITHIESAILIAALDGNSEYRSLHKNKEKF